MGSINIGSQNAKTIINEKPDGVDYKRVAEKLAEMVMETSSEALNQEGICYNLSCPFRLMKCEEMCFKDGFDKLLIQKIAAEG